MAAGFFDAGSAFASFGKFFFQLVRCILFSQKPDVGFFIQLHRVFFSKKKSAALIEIRYEEIEADVA